MRPQETCQLDRPRGEHLLGAAEIEQPGQAEAAQFIFTAHVGGDEVIHQRGLDQAGGQDVCGFPRSRLHASDEFLGVSFERRSKVAGDDEIESGHVRIR